MMRNVIAVVVVGLLAVACGVGGAEGNEDLGDAGLFDAPSAVVDDGGADEDECALLVTRACGPTATECAEAGSCEAANLLSRWEPERCGAALGDPETFAPCTEDACVTLVRKVCGDVDVSVATCQDAPSCPSAATLRDRAVDASLDADVRSEARAACAAALEDEIVFPPCPG